MRTIFQIEATAFQNNLIPFGSYKYDYINLTKTVNSTIGLTYMNNKNI